MSNPGDEYLWLNRMIDHRKTIKRFDKLFAPSRWQRFVAWLRRLQ